jgi:hypothetical protein
VGRRPGRGSTSFGVGPMPASTGNFAISAHALNSSTAASEVRQVASRALCNVGSAINAWGLKSNIGVIHI